jgi:UDP-N-acetylmuramate--alanine ligase
LSLLINNKQYNSIHFTGILGSGMSAIAQYLRWQGLNISGSDRLLNSEDTSAVKSGLLDIGCQLFEQDGSGIQKNTDALCVSTAIESSNPDIAKALKEGIPVFHRSDLLAAIISTRKTVAIAGTSGKSTVTAMVFEFLFSSGKSPSLISGANLKRLEKQGLIGNAFRGSSIYW